jgi:hypothetical protein
MVNRRYVPQSSILIHRTQAEMAKYNQKTA